jgi:hypothetical protein
MMSDLQLIEAVKTENLAQVRELIKAGVDVNQQDEQGWTPLNWAAGKGNLPLVSLLVEQGADVFKVGRDLRTPYMIALAAGHAEVVKFLRQAEDRVEGEKPSRPERLYCKAYHLRDFRRFPGWSESRINWKEGRYDGHSSNGNGHAAANGNGNGHHANGNGNGNGHVASAAGHEQPLAGDDVVFLHQDYTVTQSMWPGENVIFEQVSPAWREFCTDVLGFRVPDDLDLIISAQSVGESQPA